MTLAVQTVRVLYAGNSSTTTFAIPFNFYSTNSNVKVYLLAADGFTLTLLTYSTDYTISGSNVVAVSAPVTGTSLLIMSGLTLTQSLSLSNTQPFLPKNFETQMDEVVAGLQQLEERINRCFTLPRGSTITDFKLDAALVADSTIITDPTGTKLVIGPSTATITQAIAAAASASADAASANAAATAAASSASASAVSAAAALVSQVAAAASAVAAAASAAAAAAGAGTPIQEVLTGAIVGSDTVYTLSQTPKAAAELIGFLGTNPQVQVTNYTLSGTTVTFPGEDTTASTFFAIYRF